MSDFYTKYRRLFFALIVANTIICMLQLSFVWGHYRSHEWGQLTLSIFFALINGICAVHQYRQWRRVQREEQEFMWKTLATPSGEFR
jgi:hypothetical protein